MTDAHLYPARELKPPQGRGFWVFAYGSLMWKPGFEFEEASPALLRGYHRAFCIASTHYRGNPEVPGLVLGLDREGRAGAGPIGSPTIARSRSRATFTSGRWWAASMNRAG